MQLFRRQTAERSLSSDDSRVSDWQLIERFVEHRDQDAFERLVRLHGPMVLGVCRRITGHHQDAEEAFQAAFLVLAQKAASIWPREMVASWLYGVAYRTALKVRTATAKRRAKEKQIAMMPDPEAPLERDWQDVAPLLDRELNRLPEMYRAAVICCDVQGYTRTEAARQLGWPEGTLKVRLMRARSLLAQRLTRQGVALSAGTLAVILSQKAASAAVPATLLSATAKAAALAATPGVSTSVGVKGAALTKHFVNSLYVGKAAVVATAGGVTLAAALALTPPQKSTAPQPATSGLPAVVEQALRENARQLSPISVTSTGHMTSRLSPTETFERLKIRGPNRPDHFFDEHACRTIWEGNRFYWSIKSHNGPAGDNETTSQSDVVFDGVNQVALFGSTYTPSQAILAEQRKLGAKLAVSTRNLTKEKLATVFQRQSSPLAADLAYFQAAVGFVPVAKLSSAPGDKNEQAVRPDSAVLSALSSGSKLISVEDTKLDGRPVVRIELEGDNVIRTGALKYDLDAHRKRIERNREMLEKQSAKLNEKQKEMFRMSNEQMEHVAELIEAQRKLPATRLYTFYLDPQLHYAVRRLDQSYGPDTLLLRTDCSQFEQVSGRDIWLPRKVETQMHEYYSVPGAPFKDPFLTHVVEVTAIDGNRVPDDVFKLDYESFPGTFVRDGTRPAKASKTGDSYVSYSVPERHEDLPQVIERATNGENMVRGFGEPPTSVPLANRFRDGVLWQMAIWNLGFVGAVGAYLSWRRRRSAKR
jgi:RNA polymerase sigma factor (sigma-70 family)